MVNRQPQVVEGSSLSAVRTLGHLWAAHSRWLMGRIGPVFHHSIIPIALPRSSEADGRSCETKPVGARDRPGAEGNRAKQSQFRGGPNGANYFSVKGLGEKHGEKPCPKTKPILVLGAGRPGAAMQNKANLRRAKRSPDTLQTNGYDAKRGSWLRRNKANSPAPVVQNKADFGRAGAKFFCYKELWNGGGGSGPGAKPVGGCGRRGGIGGAVPLAMEIAVDRIGGGSVEDVHTFKTEHVCYAR